MSVSRGPVMLNNGSSSSGHVVFVCVYVCVCVCTWDFVCNCLKVCVVYVCGVGRGGVLGGGRGGGPCGTA